MAQEGAIREPAIQTSTYRSSWLLNMSASALKTHSKTNIHIQFGLNYVYNFSYLVGISFLAANQLN